MISPLRKSDLQVFCQYKNKLYAISESVSSKRQKKQQRYKENAQESFENYFMKLMMMTMTQILATAY
jgi:hypothetical protein